MVMGKTKIIGLIVVVCMVFGALVATSIYFYLRAQALEDRSPSEKQQEQIQEIVTEVSRLIALPSDETPTIATVTDPEKLKDQPFFAASVVGDRVLIYQKTKKAILYRPSEQKIIEVSVVSVSPVASESAGIAEPIRVVLYNGTTVSGLTKTYEKELLGKIPEAVVVDRDNAKKSDYATSLLVNIKGRGNIEAETYAKVLGISLLPLPEGEVKPSDTDYLIILGADRK